MKKSITVVLIIFLFTAVTFAQSTYGLKAGISYNSNGDLKEFINEIQTINDNKGSGKSGYNIGLFGKLDFGSIYIRPELIYTKTTSEYLLNSVNEEFKLSKIDAPVLLGVELIGPLNIFVGPSFQYILKNDFNGFDFETIENDFTVGFNLGASIELGRLGFDVRYERGFKKNEISFIDKNIMDASRTFSLDSRPEQLILSLFYDLGNK
jgi:hypothetical protein